MRAAYMLAKNNQAAQLLTLTSVHAARSITPYVHLLQGHNVGIESLELLNDAWKLVPSLYIPLKQPKAFGSWNMTICGTKVVLDNGAGSG